MAKDDKGKKGKDDDVTPDAIMKTAALRPLLKLAKGEKSPSAAVCMTADGEAVLLLEKVMNPKGVRKLLIKQAEEVGLEIDERSIRYGRASVDPNDTGTLILTVNREPAGSTLERELKKRVKPAGFGAIILRADPSVENESDEPQQAAPPAAPTSEADTANIPSAPPPPTESGSLPQPAMAGTDGPASPPPPPPQPQSAPQQPATAPAQPNPMLGVAKNVGEMIKLIPGVVAKAPAAKDHLRELAAAATNAVHANDPGKAAEAAEALEQALDAAVSEAAANQASPANGAAPNGAPQNDASPNGAANGQAMAQAVALLNKTGLAWTATRKAVEKQIGTLHDKMTEAYKDHGFGADLDKFFKSKVEPVLEKLDESLVETLADVGKATEPDEQKQLVEEAQKIVKRYEGYLNSEPLIKKLDKNPFVDLQIETTLIKTLETLNSTLVKVANTLH